MTKTLLLSLVILLGVSCSEVFGQEINLEDLQNSYNHFKDWTTLHKKQYGIEEMTFRFNIWKENQESIREHNAKNLSWKLEANHLAGLSHEEFSAIYSGLNANLKEDSPKQKRRVLSVKAAPASFPMLEANLTNITNNTGADNNTETVNNTNTDNKTVVDNNTNASNATNGTNDTNATNATNSTNTTNNTSATNATNKTKVDNRTEAERNATMKKSIDWRKHGAVTNVTDQGGCGACWAFSSIGALEGLYAIKYNQTAKLSEQQLVDCSDNFGNTGCYGGDFVPAFNYTSVKGVQFSKDYSYQSARGDCKYNGDKVAYKNAGWRNVTSGDYLSLKEAVSNQPVSIGIEVRKTVQFYKSGIITGDCGTSVSHGVTAVGYDTSPEGVEYWIVKNSWGPTYGENGYLRIAMGDQNNGGGICGINTLGAYPIL